MKKKKNVTRTQVEHVIENPEIMNVFSPSFDPYDGYGRMGLELIYHLDKLGLYVNAAGGNNTQRVWDTQTEHMQKLMDKPIKPMLGGFVLGYPTLYERFGNLANSGVKVAITMFESTVLPDGWMQALNDCDAVIVPAKWLVKVFKHCGVYKPIHVVPLGISETFMVADRREPYRSFTKHNPFTFLCQFLSGPGIRDGNYRKICLFPHFSKAFHGPDYFATQDIAPCSFRVIIQNTDDFFPVYLQVVDYYLAMATAAQKNYFSHVG